MVKCKKTQAVHLRIFFFVIYCNVPRLFFFNITDTRLDEILRETDEEFPREAEI